MNPIQVAPVPAFRMVPNKYRLTKGDKRLDLPRLPEESTSLAILPLRPFLHASHPRGPFGLVGPDTVAFENGMGTVKTAEIDLDGVDHHA
jgi:hypothetical protein